MTSPKLALDDLAEGQDVPEDTVNLNARITEQGAGWFAYIKDRDLTAPPGSEADGDAYIIGASATGAWSGKDGQIALFIGSGYQYVTPKEGMAAWIADEDTVVRYNSGAWGALTVAAAGAGAPRVASGTTDTLVAGDEDGIVECTNSSAVTVTIPPNADVAFSVGAFIEIHQAGTGTVTISPGSGVTLQSRGSVFDTAGQYAICGIRKMATNTWRLTGDIA